MALLPATKSEGAGDAAEAAQIVSSTPSTPQTASTHNPPPSAATRVFGIVEWLEHILTYVVDCEDADVMMDLFLLQMVNNTFARTIQRSSPLRRAMFWRYELEDSSRSEYDPLLLGLRLPADTYTRRNIGATLTGYHTDFQGSDLRRLLAWARIVDNSIWSSQSFSDQPCMFHLGLRAPEALGTGRLTIYRIKNPTLGDLAARVRDYLGVHIHGVAGTYRTWSAE